MATLARTVTNPNPVVPGTPLVYFLGAGWSRIGDFPAEASWIRYVRRFAERRDAPLVVAATRRD